MRMSDHARKDRFERINFIIDTFGVSEPYLEAPDQDGHTLILHENGFILVTNPQKSVVITGYMATPDKAWAIHKLNHKAPTEKYMLKVTRNYKIYFKKFANGEMGV